MWRLFDPSLVLRLFFIVYSGFRRSFSAPNLCGAEGFRDPDGAAAESLGGTGFLEAEIWRSHGWGPYPLLPGFMLRFLGTTASDSALTVSDEAAAPMEAFSGEEKHGSSSSSRSCNSSRSSSISGVSPREGVDAGYEAEDDAAAARAQGASRGGPLRGRIREPQQQQQRQQERTGRRSFRCSESPPLDLHWHHHQQLQQQTVASKPRKRSCSSLPRVASDIYTQMVMPKAHAAGHQQQLLQLLQQQEQLHLLQQRHQERVLHMLRLRSRELRGGRMRIAASSLAAGGLEGPPALSAPCSRRPHVARLRQALGRPPITGSQSLRSSATNTPSTRRRLLQQQLVLQQQLLQQEERLRLLQVQQEQQQQHLQQHGMQQQDRQQQSSAPWTPRRQRRRERHGVVASPPTSAASGVHAAGVAQARQGAPRAARQQARPLVGTSGRRHSSSAANKGTNPRGK